MYWYVVKTLIYPGVDPILCAVMVKYKQKIYTVRFM